MERDMTSGRSIPLILRFAIPIMLGNLFQVLYNLVDSIVAGQVVGTGALAAIGSTGTITFLIIGFVNGLSSGFSVLISQKFGAHDYKTMRKAVWSAIVMAFTIAIVITILSTTYMHWILHMMHTPEDIYDDAYKYIMIICFGIVCTVAYNMFSGMLRAIGNSKVPLYFLILASFLNIILDLVLTINFHMGVAGAAYATVVSQGVSGVLCMFYIMKKVSLLHLSREDRKLELPIMLRQLHIGIPMALQFSITAIGSMLVQSALNSFGSYYVAAYTAYTKVNQLVQQPLLALSATMSTWCAQNFGAGKYNRIREGMRISTIFFVVYCAVIGIILYFFGQYTTYVFINENLTEVVPLVQICIRCFAIFLIPLAVVNVYRNGLQGMGYSVMPMMGGVMELIGRGALAFWASASNNYLGVCLSSPAAWILAGGFYLIVYFYVMKKIIIE